MSEQFFTIRRSIGFWIGRDGKKYNNAQAALLLYNEASAFLSAVKKHMNLDRCARCLTWGRMNENIFVLQTGGRPVCKSMDCMCNKFAGEDYRSCAITTVAQLFRSHDIPRDVFNAVCDIEPLIGEVKKYLDHIEYPVKAWDCDRIVYKKFKADFDMIDAEAATV
jgi:hypothetical protein